MEVDCDSQDDGEYEELNENEELVELPDELADLRGKKFATEKALQDELDNRGFGDLRIVLWKDEPYLVSRSDEHNRFTDHYTFDFQARCSKWAHCTATSKMYLDYDRSCHPDISYWGYPRCNDRHPVTGAVCFDLDQRMPIPDVVIQFGWRNTLEYEAQIMNGMMNHGLEYKDGPRSTNRPRVGYLIMMKFSKKEKKKQTREDDEQHTHDVAGVDIYRLPHGTTVVLARDPKDPSAQHWCYKRGDPEVMITIQREDFGIPPPSPTFGSGIHNFIMTMMRALVGGLFSASYSGSGSNDYIIKASEIYRRMRNAHEVGQK